MVKKGDTDKKKKKGEPKGLRSSSDNRRKLDLQLDLFERRIEELRVIYEQYFIDIITIAPDKEHKELKRLTRALLKAPFKHSSHTFRLRQLVTRLQTYETYWTRTQKAREEGRYQRDVFKAELREKELAEAAKAATQAGAAEKGFQQLFDTYEKAIKKSGGNAGDLNYGSFKKSLINQAQALKKKGVKKLSYKIVMKNGKAVVKAVAKKN